MNKLYAAGGLIALLGLAGWGLINYGRSLERADHNEKVVALQDQLAEKTLEILEFESQAADDTRKLEKANRERNHAIQTNDHQTAEVKRLEQAIRQERKAAQDREPDKPTGADVLNYRVIVTDAVYRVYNEARSCSGLAKGKSASILQKRLHEITGDDISRTIAYVSGEYCSCAVKYNELWRSADRLLNECNKKRALE